MEWLKEELGEEESQGVCVMIEKTEDVCRKGNSQKGRKSVKKSLCWQHVFGKICCFGLSL